MVRHTEAVDDESTTTTRRTRADLRYLANAVRGARVDTDAATDASRNSRLVDHGWFTSQGGVTGDGAKLARVVGALANDEVEHDDVDYAIDVMGMATFVDEALRASSAGDFAGWVRGILVVANTIDEARHHAGTQDVEYDHDGLFEGHFADEGFDARNGKVEVRFEREATARVWAVEDAPDRFDIEYKHDERFNGNRNPRRLVVDVMA